MMIEKQSRQSFAILLLLTICSRAAGADNPQQVEFNRDIRPILSDHCFQCHGPDERQRKADLRLDIEENFFANRPDGAIVVRGDILKSHLIERVTSSDEQERMPPAKFARPLSPGQIELLKLWVVQGAKWQKHWSFLPFRRPELPEVSNPGWCQSPVDRFILARLEQSGLTPAPEADRNTLIRRVTLDLTGLPPTPEQVQEFVNDPSPNAFERVVERLLASPRYGERMANRWLDGARYADTSGYQSDGERYMWRWRDWVIDAFNQNMPFDQFTIEQLAGDLLPNPTLEQRIATGFNRNHRGNAEGGIVPEEYAVEYVVDRVDTTFAVWQGLTMGCARCHDHKFDPIHQQEYYRVFALFNNVPEKGRAAKYGNSPPYIAAPTREQQVQLDALTKSYEKSLLEWEARRTEVARQQKEWEATRPEVSPDVDAITEGLVVRVTFDHSDEPVNPGAVAQVVEPARGYFSRNRPGDSPIAKPKEFPKQFVGDHAPLGDGIQGKSLACNGQTFYQAGNVASFGFYDPYTCSLWVKPEGNKGGTVLSKMSDVAEGDGWYVLIKSGKLQVHLAKRYLDDAIRVETEDPIPSNVWSHLTIVYDGSRSASGIGVFLNGKAVRLVTLLDELNQTYNTNEPLRIGGGSGPEGRFHGLIDELRIYNRRCSPEEATILATITSIPGILSKPESERTPAENLKLGRYFTEQKLPPELAALRDRIRQQRDARREFMESLPTVMVMQELPQPRTTHVLIRGEYDKPGAAVQPGVPADLTNGQDERIQTRLEFARWLVRGDQPLTARVQVNRLWQMYFGTGIVKTVDDLGSQGEWPSHPELLDWLASEFINTGWDWKQLHRRIVLSATYRQSSAVTAQKWTRDPENRLLGRGPRVRLSAEMIRDQALFASGLMIETLGGPSVLPYQPEGLWKDLTGTDFTPEHGSSLYRRSLYTFWKRTVAPPGMVMFDASTRETCTIRETRTNTPLQALNLMNDVTYIEASRALAERVLLDKSIEKDGRTRRIFELILGRSPTRDELALLSTALAYHLERFQKSTELAHELLKVGDSKPNVSLGIPELAAYSAVAQLVLNLDEAVTK